jgi:hypothetical protein
MSEPKQYLFEVHIVKELPKSEFKTRCTLLFPFNNPEILPLDTVMIGGGEGQKLFKTYAIYLKREDQTTARFDGIEMIKEFRRTKEGIQC